MARRQLFGKNGTTQHTVYPDLSPVIQQLITRAEEVPLDRRALIEKWCVQLHKIQQEMQHLQKLEKFSKAIQNKEAHPHE